MVVSNKPLGSGVTLVLCLCKEWRSWEVWVRVIAMAYRVDGTGASGKGTDAYLLHSQEKGKGGLGGRILN